jgi:hypothetical protein
MRHMALGIVPILLAFPAWCEAAIDRRESTIDRACRRPWQGRSAAVQQSAETRQVHTAIWATVP